MSADSEFSFRQCWTCSHMYLDIGGDSQKRDYKCDLHAAVCKTRGESCKPTDCKDWTR